MTGRWKARIHRAAERAPSDAARAGEAIRRMSRPSKRLALGASARRRIADRIEEAGTNCGRRKPRITGRFRDTGRMVYHDGG